MRLHLVLKFEFAPARGSARYGRVASQLEHSRLPETDASTRSTRALTPSLQRAAAVVAQRLPQASAWTRFAAVFAASTLSLWPLWKQPGWPANHESCVWATRVGVLQAAWHRGELLPLWWREGNAGLGSPMPALYHKLQNFVCALLLELFGNIEWAEMLSLLLFSVLGCLGLRRLARQLGASPWTATLHAMLLPFTSYVATDWLVRGAFAEHAGFMLLPWLLVGLLELIEHGRVRVGLLGGMMIALFYAHSMTALFSVGLIVIAALIALARHPGRAGHILGQGTLAALCFFLAIAPTVWVMRVLAEYFYLDHTVGGVYDVHRHLTNLTNALFGERRRINFSPVLDVELWVAIAGAALLALPRRLRSSSARPWADPALGFLLLGCALMTFLRLKAAGPIYDWVPGLRYIQFPWRLMSFMTVLLIGLSAALFGRIQARLAIPLASALLLVLAVRSPVFRYEEVRLPHAELVAALAPTHDVRWWEYVPTVPGPANEYQMSAWAEQPTTVSDTCSVRAEGCPRCFVAECTAPGTIALPYAFTSLELVTDGAGRPVPVFRDEDDARVLVDMDTGRTELHYHKPSWINLGRRLLLSLGSPR